jgi:cation diffusion facilitator family transporter
MIFYTDGPVPALNREEPFLIQYLIRHWLEGKDPKSPEVRQMCGTRAGGVGILLNTLLCLGKLLAGMITGSIAIIGDALNNLSDAASSVITLIGFRLAGQEADEEHPFGHGRMEYLAGLVVSMAILLMGFELGKSSVEKLLHPEELDFSWLAVVILAASVAVKVWMYFFNRTLAQKISSETMAATAADSLSDSAATSVVLLATLVGHFFQWKIDGFAGLLVAVFILKTGWEAAKDTLDPLLGRPMDPELATDIDQLVLSHENILGIHDLVYHDYGPGRAMMSFHAEVPADADLLEMHDLIDHIERELKEKHHIETVIHMDPVVNDERTAALREQVAYLAQQLDPCLTIHDLRITAGPHHTNVLFDVMVPYGFRLTDHQVVSQLRQEVEALSPKYSAVIQVDHSYVERREK